MQIQAKSASVSPPQLRILEGDGWPDVACDSTPSRFFQNKRDGTFAEEGLDRGVALNQDGMEQAGMSIAWGDVNNYGQSDIVKTHFADDTPILYEGTGHGRFGDVTLQSGLGVETRYVGWGVSTPDLDNAGWRD